MSLVRLMLAKTNTLIPESPGKLVRYRSGMGPPLKGMWAIPPVNSPPLTISGVTKTGNGTTLANCIVELYRLRDDVRVETINSDGIGAFSFSQVSPGELYYCVAYKVGSPDVAGTTSQLLAGTISINIYLRDPTAQDSAGGGNTYIFGVNE